ncbi:hypothetical protein CCACVL1_17440 [Corchorus capsularis]|uniref:Uncharacterized protein n=1 Tax=Corchorus capsularis TaxID=210143 RepID=A0A1R3HRX7_COCAP|nr:hypothetical protein CCACVL1_17440 [Corchorus capsularis]
MANLPHSNNSKQNPSLRHTKTKKTHHQIPHSNNSKQNPSLRRTKTKKTHQIQTTLPLKPICTNNHRLTQTLKIKTKTPEPPTQTLLSANPKTKTLGQTPKLSLCEALSANPKTKTLGQTPKLSVCEALSIWRERHAATWRERERQAARLALQKLEQSVNGRDNMQIFDELKALCDIDLEAQSYPLTKPLPGAARFC